MSLKNIQLPAIVIANLYKYSLVDFQQVEKKPIPPASEVFAGANNKRILILVNNAAAELLPADQLTFLSGVLKACKLSMDDVYIVNLDKASAPDHTNIPGLLTAEKVILFGLELSVLALPFKIPSFQVQLHKDKKYVQLPALHIIQNDAVLKRKLWELLKVLFSI